MRPRRNHHHRSWLAWQYRRYRSKDHGRWRYRHRRWRNHGKDRQYRQRPRSSCRHRSNRCTDACRPCLMIKMSVKSLILRKIQNWGPERPKELKTLILTLGVVGKTSTSEIKWVDNGQWEGTSETTGGNVGGHLGGVWSLLGDIENLLDLALEGEVQGLGWEVTDDVSQVTTPEWGNTLLSQSTLSAVDNTLLSMIDIWFNLSSSLLF